LKAGINVSVEHTAFIFTAEKEGSMFLRSVGVTFQKTTIDIFTAVKT
jgi:hypothetical protein